MGDKVSKVEFNAVKEEEEKLKAKVDELEKLMKNSRPAAQHQGPEEDRDEQVGYIHITFTGIGIMYVSLLNKFATLHVLWMATE